MSLAAALSYRNAVRESAPEPKYQSDKYCIMSGIDVPADVYDALAVPENDRDAVIYRELAVSLYREGYLSFGKARELSGLSKQEFHRLLGQRSVERHYSDADLADDVEYASQ